MANRQRALLVTIGNNLMRSSLARIPIFVSVKPGHSVNLPSIVTDAKQNVNPINAPGFPMAHYDCYSPAKAYQALSKCDTQVMGDLLRIGRQGGLFSMAKSDGVIGILEAVAGEDADHRGACRD